MKIQKLKFTAIATCFLLASMLLSFNKAVAQTTADKLAHIMMDSLAYLKLTDQQKSQAAGFNKTAAASLVQLDAKAQKDTSLHGKALAQQVVGIMKQRNTSLKAILTPEQQKLYKDHKAQQLADLQTKVMTAQLGLSPDQVPKVYSVNLKSAQQMAGDMGDLKQTTSKFQKMGAAQALQSASADKLTELKKILSPDQFTKYIKYAEQMKSVIQQIRG
ncbi:hypothetical protein ACFGVR_06705 [Mucilaginibacter sp. AW1-3]